MSSNEKNLLRLVEQLRRENTQLRNQATDASHSRIMAEEALGQTEDRLQMALNAAGLAMWEWDIVNQVIYTSASFATMIGEQPSSDGADQVWHAQQLIVKVFEQDAHTLRGALVRVFKEPGSRLEVELHIRSATGILWIECTGEVTQRDMLGRAERMAGINRNVTRRRQAQIEIETARAQAEAANAAKDEFLANISHEIRTPLNGVLGMNNLLAQTQLSSEQRQYVELVSSSGRALLALVNDVLDYSRLTAHKIILEQVRFPLRRWLWEVTEPQRLAAQAKGLELRLHADEALPQEVVGDPGRLRQIVTNLISNAIKFTEQGHVQVLMQLAGSDAQHITLRLEVSDTGIGIAPDQQRSIFSAFVQADSSTSRRYGGTGLGLSICSKLVEVMGGSMQLHSTVGEGSRFTIEVPLGIAQDNVPGTQFGYEELDGLQPHSSSLAFAIDSTHPMYAGKAALVVDDHSVNQLLATKLLQRLGFEVAIASDGEQALQAVLARKYDVVFMDIQMPHMNGWEAAQHIRHYEQSENQTRIPIIALSAHASAADREQAFAYGMDGYLSKPLTPEALQAALRSTRLNVPAALPHANTPQAATEPMPLSTLVSATPALGDSVNQQRLLTRLGGDRTALHEMANAFCHDLRERMSSVFTALKQSDWPTLRQQAHALKGSLLTMTADEAAEHAKALELAAQSQNIAAAQTAFKHLSQAAKQAYDAVKNW
jgi:signal transduction histidine kinase/FixJ family two-component response regulator/HPt (histidine-containing phosphotransfer) domain-containing protein